MHLLQYEPNIYKFMMKIWKLNIQMLKKIYCINDSISSQTCPCFPIKWEPSLICNLIWKRSKEIHERTIATTV